MQQFKVATRRHEPIEFQIDGDDHTYVFTPRKQAKIVIAASGVVADDETTLMPVVRAQFDWLDEGLGKEQAARIEARLRDPDDDLDVDTVAEVIRWLIGEMTGRPTTPPSG